MKKLLLSFLLLSCCLAAAQNTIVTATITNPADSQVFSGGTVVAIFTPPNGLIHQQEYLINGSQFQYFVSGTMDGTGTFVITVTDDHLVRPFGGRWNFKICSRANIPCFYSLQDAFGASINLSSQISNDPAAPTFKINMQEIPRAYLSTEVNFPNYQNAPGDLGGGLMYMMNDQSLNYSDALGVMHKLCTNDGFITGCGGGGTDTDFYQIMQLAGVSKPQEGKLNFIQGTNITITLNDNPGNGSTDATISASFTPPTDTDFYQIVAANGTNKPQENILNLIQGTNMTISCVDNVGNTSTDCTFNASTGGGSNPYDISGTLIGAPDPGLIIQRWPAPRTVNFATNCTPSQGVVGIAPTNSAAFSMQKNGVQFGTMNFAASATTATFTCTATTFNLGDVFTLVSPNPQDATLSDVGWSFAALR